MESMPADTSSVPRDQSVARGNPSVCCLSATSNSVPRSHYTAVGLECVSFSFLFKYTTPTLNRCLEWNVLLCQTDISGWRAGRVVGLCRGRARWGWVIPTKTRLRLVLIERKNVLADRSFQPGCLGSAGPARKI